MRDGAVSIGRVGTAVPPQSRVKYHLIKVFRNRNLADPFERLEPLQDLRSPSAHRMSSAASALLIFLPTDIVSVLQEVASSERREPTCKSSDAARVPEEVAPSERRERAILFPAQVRPAHQGAGSQVG